jgi:hypothetical protein
MAIVLNGGERILVERPDCGVDTSQGVLFRTLGSWRELAVVVLKTRNLRSESAGLAAGRC